MSDEGFLLNTSLLREKFFVRDLTGTATREPLIALSNRIHLPLVSVSGQIAETFVVRAHTMQTALRMAAFIARSFYAEGPLMPRASLFDWENHWADLVSDFERRTNPKHWGAVYANGKTLFTSGAYHPFLDIVEQCDIRNRENYEEAIKMAEASFEKAGKAVKIDHDATIGVVVGAGKQRQRCGLIYRNPNRQATFSFNIAVPAEQTKAKGFEPQHCFFHAAAWLEAINLAVGIGFKEAKIKTGVAFESEALQASIEGMKKQLGRVNAEIRQLENRMTINYRPEAPDLFQLMAESEEYARLEPLREHTKHGGDLV